MCRNPTLLISMRTKFLQLLFSPTIRSLKRDLGMLFDKHMNLHHAASHALRPFNVALRRVQEFGIEKRISDRPHAMFGFSRHALSAGMYAS